MVPKVERLAARAAAAAGGAGTVVLASDRSVKRLNARHRGRNKPTNVLTFETGDVVLAGGWCAARRVLPSGAWATFWRIWWSTARCICAAMTMAGRVKPGRMELRETRILHSLRVPNPWRRA